MARGFLIIFFDVFLNENAFYTVDSYYRLLILKAKDNIDQMLLCIFLKK